MAQAQVGLSEQFSVDGGKPSQAACAQCTGLTCSYEGYDFLLFPVSERGAASKRSVGQSDIHLLGMSHRDASFLKLPIDGTSWEQCYLMTSWSKAKLYYTVALPVLLFDSSFECRPAKGSEPWSELTYSSAGRNPQSFLPSYIIDFVEICRQYSTFFICLFHSLVAGLIDI